jgi:hypothetical protein
LVAPLQFFSGGSQAFRMLDPLERNPQRASHGVVWALGFP